MTHHCLIVFTLVTLSLCFHGTFSLDYKVVNAVAQSPGGIRFDKDYGAAYAKQVMGEANNFIWGTVLQQSSPAERKPIKDVTLYIDAFQGKMKGGVALTWDTNKINISAPMIATYNYQGPEKWDCKKEITAIIYHEMTHVLQYGGGGSKPAPGGLTEGIADFTKIKANLMQPGFCKPGAGSKWDEGYDPTARFLQYCDSLSPGFVAKLNKKIKDSYDAAYFKELTGKPLEQLWKEYKAKG